jgi:Fe-S cluster biosynthesis and repair protein YggX
MLLIGTWLYNGAIGGCMSRKVFCSKFKKELPGLEKPPFAGEIGKMIYERVSAEAWEQWSKDMQIKVLNEYRLNMADPRDYKVLVDQMMRFLALEEGSVAEVENADRGRKQ